MRVQVDAGSWFENRIATHYYDVMPGVTRQHEATRMKHYILVVEDKGDHFERVTALELGNCEIEINPLSHTEESGDEPKGSGLAHDMGKRQVYGMWWIPDRLQFRLRVGVGRQVIAMIGGMFSSSRKSSLSNGERFSSVED